MLRSFFLLFLSQTVLAGEMILPSWHGPLADRDFLQPIIQQNREYVTPTILVSEGEMPNFTDDFDFKGMDEAIDRQLKHYRKFPSNSTVRFGEKTYPVAQIGRTLEAFKTLIKRTRKCLKSTSKHDALCYQSFQEELMRNYDVYRPNLVEGDPRFGDPNSTFFTAYYTPTLPGALNSSAEFPYGIYKKPTDETLRRKTRAQIHFDNALVGSGNALFYTNDLFELYLMHVQGGGRVVVNQGGVKRSYYLHFNGSNGQPFRWISLYMRDKGYITGVTIDEQRDFLRANPEKQREIYEFCPSYVWYSVDSEPPVGSGMVSLTPRRSLATDHNYYKYKGVLAFVEAKRPTEDSAQRSGPAEFQDFSRFMLDQDTGSAIKGKARVDLYHGEDKYAEKAAYNTQHQGKIFFLMLK